MTSDKIQLSSSSLRSTDLQISGSGLGSWTKEEVKRLFIEILPETFQLAAEGKLKIENLNVPLKDIGKLWDITVSDGQRLVVTI